MRLLVVALALICFLAGALSVRYCGFPFGTDAAPAGVATGSGPLTAASPQPAAPVVALPNTAHVDRSTQVRRKEGKWHKAPDWVQGNDAENAADGVAMADSPYLRGVKPAPTAADVTFYNPDAAHDGVNLVLSGHGPEASLRDMKGRVLHTWRYEFEKVWPGKLGFAEYPVHKTFWRRVKVLANGDLLAIFEGIGMIKLDRDSNLLWATKCRSHHDLWVDAEGRIYTLTHASRQLTSGPILEDFIVVLSPDGEELQKVSLLDAFLGSRYSGILRAGAGIKDLFHSNTIVLLDGSLAGRVPAFAAGSVLVSIRNLDALAVVDLRRGVVTWAMTGMWGRQHQPSVLDNGNLLLFDNVGDARGSQVLEFDPATQRVAWNFGATKSAPFQSAHAGSCQRLANGNTLIVESLSGRALEVTPEKKIVWEFVNPHRAGDRDELIAVLYDVVRVDWDELAQFPELDALRAAAREGVEVGGVESLLEKVRK